MKKRKTGKLNIFILCMCVWISCKKDYPPEKVDSNDQPKTDIRDTFRILVCNEGNFGFGNGSLSLIEFPAGKVTKNVLNGAGIAQSLDILQSVTRWNNSYYLVANNNQKVLQLRESDFHLEKEIEPFVSPRYITFAGNRFWISDLYANAVTMVDPSSGITTGQISFPGWSEEMVAMQKYLWIAAPEGNKTYCIHTGSLVLSDSLITGANGGWICKGGENEVYVLSSGKNANPPVISCISDSSRSVTRQFILPFAPEKCKKLVYHSVSERLFFLAGDLYSIGKNGTELRKEYSANASENLYGLEIHSSRNLLLLTNARNYLSDGELLIFDLSRGFSQPYRVETGKIPGECLID